MVGTGQSYTSTTKALRHSVFQLSWVLPVDASALDSSLGKLTTDSWDIERLDFCFAVGQLCMVKAPHMID